MTASITVSPNPIGGGQLANVSGTGYDPKARVTFTTVDNDCHEVPVPGSGIRTKRDGSFALGIVVPKASGDYRIRSFQRGKFVTDYLGAVS